MYANVLALMAIFAAIFTLVNVNVVAAGKCLSQVLVLNLTTVGSFGALVALITAVVKPRNGGQESHLGLWPSRLSQ